MSLPIKSADEVFVIGRRVSNRFKGLPSEIEVRVKEHSRPFVIRSLVHIVWELNKLINSSYPYLSTQSAHWYPEQEQGPQQCRCRHCRFHFSFAFFSNLLFDRVFSIPPPKNVLKKKNLTSPLFPFFFICSNLKYTYCYARSKQRLSSAQSSVNVLSDANESLCERN